MPSTDHSATEGPPDFWFINSLITFVAEAPGTGGSFAVYRQVAPPGFATPYHTHAAYGEGFCVLEGEVTFFCDGVRTTLRKDGFLYLPGTLPHGFRVSGAEAATMMIISSPGSTFGAFVKEMGEPAAFHGLPVPSRSDFARLAALSQKYGSSILGPLPE